MDDGEPYVHLDSLAAHVSDNMAHAAPALVPGMQSVLDFLTSTHDSLILSDRKD